LAFPDRIAVRRQETDEYLFATGERAVLSRSSRAKNSRIIVATDWRSGDAKLGSPSITITRATPIDEEMLFDLYPDLLTSRTGYEWNNDGARVERISESCFWSAPIETVRHPAAAGDEAGGLLLGAELRRRGLRWIVHDEMLCPLLGRLAIATTPTAPFAGISASETDLIEWIANFPHRAVSHRQLIAWIEDGGLYTALSEHLGYQWREKLNEWCPETISLPGRARATIQYELGQAPVVMSRIQDFFGAGELTRIAGGTQPLRIHLLAPNGRTVQVTENLKTFWSLHYPVLRKQLQSRYPRHRWPEDPTQPCPPTQRAASPNR
jgi:ATP-dependent helicase HrpB